MRLTTIKLAGFKSFVDPTTLHLPTNMTGIVGPNGCGKSNIIDAIRWVMGESAASRLRGDSLTDVIFSGSSARKPVGQAMVELIFDNSDGTVQGEFAQYAEISVKRTVSRDGQSQYFLNGSRCRRRDITDIFLGTGLGPRSYSIIEQGMISQIIDAHPDELRGHLEEAAGISKYKERRKETENRIRHTRENLERVSDVREEVEKQLEHLNRQARAAERWKGYKEEQRRKQAELQALEYRKVRREHAAHGERSAPGRTGHREARRRAEPAAGAHRNRARAPPRGQRAPQRRRRPRSTASVPRSRASSSRCDTTGKPPNAWSGRACRGRARARRADRPPGAPIASSWRRWKPSSAEGEPQARDAARGRRYHRAGAARGRGAAGRLAGALGRAHRLRLRGLACRGSRADPP